MMWYFALNNGVPVALSQIPVVDYLLFRKGVCEALTRPECRMVHYFAVRQDEGLRFFILIADDQQKTVAISSHLLEESADKKFALSSMTSQCYQMHPFEREIAELYGVRFEGSPWAKPLRYPSDRADQQATIDNYPFYHIEGDSLHEVNVGPIHAGIIEPGAFRFICNGERVLHLEIALGYQHRGVENLMTASPLLKKVCLAESVAGDCAVGHATAHAMVAEGLAGWHAGRSLSLQRALALELERMAMHIADTGALCTDIGYQLGQVACEALRTIVINTTQRICGNRFGKGMVRPAGSWCAINDELSSEIEKNIKEVVRRFTEIKEDLKSSPSVLARFEECGVVTLSQARRTGLLGVAARASGLSRDARTTHPWGAYMNDITHENVCREQGDVMSRLMVRCREVLQSGGYVSTLLAAIAKAGQPPFPDYSLTAAPLSLCFSMVEGWRGEICHVAVTDQQGALAAYKIKDPSVHNWLGLALAVRGAGISDFPICNKSFNLSYCGHDL